MSEEQNVSKLLGNTIGHCWRTEVATQEQAAKLRGLWSKLNDKASDLWDSWFEEEGSAYTPGERLFFVLSPKEDGDRGCQGPQRYAHEQQPEGRADGSSVRAFGDQDEREAI